MPVAGTGVARTAASVERARHEPRRGVGEYRMSEQGRIRRRATIAVVVLAIVGAVGGSVALRAA
jgi:hypothetical protein